MKILKGRIRWMELYANSPRVELLVEDVPKFGDLLFEKNGGIYYAELDGYVSFLSYTRPGSGFGGSRFLVNMSDGSKEELIGPWSGNSIAANERGFGPCIEMSYVDNLREWERGYTFTSGAVTVEALLKNDVLIDVGRSFTWVRWNGESKEELGTVEFPEGSQFTLLRAPAPWFDRELSREQLTGLGRNLDTVRRDLMVPAVKLPDGRIWMKPDFNEQVEMGFELAKRWAL